jgi:replicative DNA helicase
MSALIDLQTEEKVIGTALMLIESLPLVAELDDDVFTTPMNKQVFSTIKDNYLNGRSADVGISNNDLIHYADYITNDIESCIEIIKNKAHARSLLDLFRKSAHSLMEGTPADMVASHVMGRIADDEPVKSTVNAIGDSMFEVFKNIHSLRDGTKKLGLTTGLDFEKHFFGFEAGKFYVVAARPAMGKSAFALEIIRRVAKAGTPVGMMSLEMSHTSLALRLLTTEMEVDGKLLRQGKLNDYQLEKLQMICGELSELPIYFDDNSYVTADALRTRAAYFKRKKNIGMLVIDYLQLMTGDNDNRERDIAEISRTCKIISKELEIPVIALAQLNRGVEIREDKRPRLSDLRESGAIEQDADVVMFLYRPEYYGIEHYPDTEGGNSTQNICEVIISKNRDGDTGYVQQVFDPSIMRFANKAPSF